MTQISIDAILSRLVDEFSTPETVGLLLVGSQAKRTASPHSDVDITRFVSGEPPMTQLFSIREGVVFDVVTRSLPTAESLFSQAQMAIFAIPRWRTGRILYDPTGRLAHIQAAAQGFQWASIQDAANASASYGLYMKSAEVVTLLHAIERDDFYPVYVTSGYVLLWLVQAVAVRYGVMFDNEKQMFTQVRDQLGAAHEWSRALDIASGMKAVSGMSTAESRGRGTLHLYAVTARLFEDVLSADHRRLIQHALARIQPMLTLNLT